MSDATPPSGDPFVRGVLVGCSPLILLFLVFFLVAIANFGRVPDARSPDGPPPLPTVNSAAPVASLLPTPPKGHKAPVYLGDDLACVPELTLEEATPAPADEWRLRKAHVAAVALHLNGKEEDGFLKALLRARPDLAGAPFTMGPACRTTGDCAKAFLEAANAVQSHKGAALLAEKADANAGGEKREQFYRAHLAVATQVLPVADAAEQVALVRGLSSIPRPEAAGALTRVAVFSTHEAVRTAAIEALAVRREGASADVLAASLRYPWPAVAGNAARAIVQLKRKDLIPHLRALLDAPDPRGPRTETVAGRKQAVAHEMVRVNHHRNCLLCHAPAERGKTPAETLVAEVPVPTETLPNTAAGYGQSESNLLVRIDVTYLRQDFSATLEVKDWTAEAWPTTQRFDFLVRKRVLAPDEAADLRTRLAGASPYRHIAAQALRELTGGDIGLHKGFTPW